MSVFNDFLDIPFNKFGEHTSQLFVLLTDFFFVQQTKTTSTTILSLRLML